MADTLAPTLAEWLLAQIAADEQVARDIKDRVGDRTPWIVFGNDWPLADYYVDEVIAECEAKRRIAAMHVTFAAPSDAYCAADSNMHPCETLRLLALPYADRDGYRKEWRL